MDAAALWKRYQDWLYYHEGLGLYLDVSRMSFDDAFVEQLTPRFEQAFKAMDGLEGGGRSRNPDENRMVGHYWLRNPEIAPSEEIKQSITGTLSAIKDFAAKVRSGGDCTTRPKSLYRCALCRHWRIGPWASVRF